MRYNGKLIAIPLWMCPEKTGTFTFTDGNVYNGVGYWLTYRSTDLNLPVKMYEAPADCIQSSSDFKVLFTTAD